MGKKEHTILILSELVIFRGLQEKNINDKNRINSKNEFLYFKIDLKQIGDKKVLGVKWGKDSRGGEAGHWTERSEGSG